MTTTELKPDIRLNGERLPEVSPALAGPRAEIMIDTYNLRLQHGSGIKTYGLSLMEAIRRIGHDVTLLTDRSVPNSRFAVLNEVMLYDHERRRKSRLNMVANCFGDAVRRSRPTPIDFSYVVRHNGYLPPGTGRVHNLYRVYEMANWRFQYFRRMTNLRLRHAPQIWHATAPLPIRVRGARTITTIHDLIPLRLPYATLDDKRFFFNVVRRSLRESDLVLAVSECTKRDILELFDVAPEKIVVTYQALASAAPAGNDTFIQTLLNRHDLTRNRYLLFVGNIEPKKNVSGLIRAVSMLPRELPLVIVGRKAWLWRQQLEAARHYFGGDPNRSVRLLGYLPTEIVQALYANAFCFIFPSLYEGFGLPPLEAMRQGCPVLASRTASLPEVCGDAALYFQPDDVDEIRATVERLLGDSELRARLVAEGYRRVEHFSAERYAQRLAQAYVRVLQ